MLNRFWELLGAAGGIFFAALAMTANTVFFVEVPARSASREALAAFFAESSRSAGAQMALAVFAYWCFVLFVARLWGTLRRAEGNSGWLSAAALGGGLLTFAVKSIEFPLRATALRAGTEGVDPQAVRMLLDVGGYTFVLSWFTLALLLAGTAGVALRTGALPRWLGWAAALLAMLLLAVGLLAIATGTETGALAFPLVLLWIAVASVVLIRRAVLPPADRHEPAPPRGQPVVAAP